MCTYISRIQPHQWHYWFKGCTFLILTGRAKLPSTEVRPFTLFPARYDSACFPTPPPWEHITKSRAFHQWEVKIFSFKFYISLIMNKLFCYLLIFIINTSSNSTRDFYFFDINYPPLTHTHAHIPSPTSSPLHTCIVVLGQFSSQFALLKHVNVFSFISKNYIIIRFPVMYSFPPCAY